MRTSASRQTATGSVFPVGPTKIFQRQLPGPSETLHLRGKPWHDQKPRAEQHRAVQVHQREWIPLVEAVLRSQRSRERHRPAPSHLNRHRPGHAENQYIRIPASDSRPPSRQFRSALIFQKHFAPTRVLGNPERYKTAARENPRGQLTWHSFGVVTSRLCRKRVPAIVFGFRQTE